MTQDEIIEMAKLVGFEMDDSGVLSPQVVWYIYHESLIKFAKLVDAKATARERVACFDAAFDAHATTAVLEAIRARSISRGEA